MGYLKFTTEAPFHFSYFFFQLTSLRCRSDGIHASAALSLSLSLSYSHTTYLSQPGKKVKDGEGKKEEEMGGGDC